MKMLTITRDEEKKFAVVSGANTYTVAAQPKWSCTCPARGMCKHLRTVLASFGMAIGQTLTLAPVPKATETTEDEPQVDYDVNTLEISEEIAAAKMGRGAYRRFLGY
jgi:uncharacterized Zn finger protein